MLLQPKEFTRLGNLIIKERVKVVSLFLLFERFSFEDLVLNSIINSYDLIWK